MKKIINKLFEKLGYVPKGRLVALECLRSSIARTSSLVHRQNTNCYRITDCNNQFIMVSIYDEVHCVHTAIKCFPYGEDKDYAKLCAEELYEMLKQD